MSLMDVGRNRKSGPPGLDPPSASLRAILGDLRWHARIYAMEGLDRRTQLAFLGLRIVQRIAYNRGWNRAGRR